MKFSDFNLDQRILEGLKALQFEEPTPIQEEGIPVILEGKDLVGLAQTGTGKTGAFVIPILQHILQSGPDRPSPQTLILTPTRELAKQVDEMVFAMGYHTGVSSATVIGGEDFSAQARHIREGVDILVATPGRLLDILKVLNFELDSIGTLVLDEADRMLDMGFYPDVSKIVRKLPEKRQTMLFSATMSSQIEKLSRKMMDQPTRIEFEVSKPVETVEQHAYFVDNKQKLDLVERIFEKNDWESAIVFAATKKWTEKLHQKLQKRGINSVSIHGDRSQEERNEALQAFRNGENPVIVATDVLSRGIDIDDVSMIVNYDLPQNSDDYIHRIGRTGRHKQSGVAITFVTKREKGKYKSIKQEVGLEVKEYQASELLNGSGSRHKKRKSDTRRRSSSSQTQKSKTKSRKTSKEQNKKSSGGTRSTRKRKSSSSTDSTERSSTSKRSRNRSSRSKSSGKDTSGKKESPASKRSSSARSKKDRPGAARSKSSKDKNSSKSAQGSRKGQRAKGTRSEKGRESRKKRETKERENNMMVERIEKAIHRNKNARKPAKGVWGILKSMIPRIKRD